MVRKVVRRRVPLPQLNPLKVLGLVRRLLGDVAIHIEGGDVRRLRLAGRLLRGRARSGGRARATDP